MSKYEISTDEGVWQPGAEAGVLKNLRGLTLKDDIDAAETKLLEDLYFEVLGNLPDVLTFDDICRWHRRWLGNLYDWAGKLRTVNMSKGDFHFAAVTQLPAQCQQFDAEYLSEFKFLFEMESEPLIEHLARTHAEFILIHPFREGNGRLSRLLMSAQLVQAGRQPMDFQLWDEHKKFYFKSIQASVGGDYQHIKRLVSDSLTS
ncbi:Fic family protein [Oceanobacter sp. 3_MG-2023]|uniref:Fic/DOC family protein n=1 Tax=Oceanobacter sp. 3_MG-2023 TaxID=3062622 RepID=UPI0027375AF0|nr:Fic family protein [Oceanobacter sp. 3_MG-2023]MDP2505885.1 Fic family protein [Oceanobacter sp. 3_MG-2023]